MQTLYEHSRRILAVFLIAALLCLAIIGPLPDTQSSATLTCTTTGIAAIFLVVVASHADPHFGLVSRCRRISCRSTLRPRQPDLHRHLPGLSSVPKSGNESGLPQPLPASHHHRGCPGCCGGGAAR